MDAGREASWNDLSSLVVEEPIEETERQVLNQGSLIRMHLFSKLYIGIEATI